MNLSSVFQIECCAALILISHLPGGNKEASVMQFKDLFTKSHILGSILRNEHVTPKDFDFTIITFKQRIQILHANKVLLYDEKEDTVTIGT